MQLHAPMRTLTPTVDGDVLTVLARADEEFTVSDLHRVVASRSSEGIRKALERLVEQGVVIQRQIGRAYTFRLNLDHLAAHAIIELNNLPSLLRAGIAGVVKAWAEPASLVAIFGSAARGEMKPSSDIDLALVHSADVTERWDAQVASLENDVSIWTGNDCRVLQLNARDIAGRHNEERVLRDILRDGIIVVGDRDAFRMLIGAE